ncbi:MAG: hypothetical protein P8J87_05385, partial [Verrucomicrobiales bacterium]|nr:hypothetical protein [Verrucomicrobiales bacterium]
MISRPLAFFLTFAVSALGQAPVALYDFASTDGDTVHDRSGVAPPLDLKISEPKSVHRTPGSLEVRAQTIIRSETPAKKIIDAVQRTGELTIEAWIKPAKTDQSGPARIITLSRNGSERNATLGQDGDRFDARLRTTSTSTNGIPSINSKPESLTNKLTHIVYTRDRSGRAQIFIDGKSVTASKVAGKLDNWDNNYTLALGNEHSNDRLWLGTYHRVAIYARALHQEHVAASFKAGANTSIDPALIAASKPNPDAEFFESKIAPILARNCLECHDNASKKGKLNLAQRTAALAGGKNGKAIV